MRTQPVITVISDADKLIIPQFGFPHLLANTPERLLCKLDELCGDLLSNPESLMETAVDLLGAELGKDPQLDELADGLLAAFTYPPRLPWSYEEVEDYLMATRWGNHHLLVWVDPP